jgi:succinyl-CoA synthetase alpha subunit
VVKAQVKTGGRGKAGGVELADNPEHTQEKAAQIVGLNIKGHTVDRVMVAQAADVAEECYFSILLDCAKRAYLAMTSVQGGMDARTPGALARVLIDPLIGVDADTAREIVEAAAFPPDVREAVDAGMPMVVVIVEGVPVHDAVQFIEYAANSGATRLIGPNCHGLISPGQSNAGIIPAHITTAGTIGLVSKSGTLTYQLMHELRDLGFSTCVGIGGDPVVGTTRIDCIQAFEDDPATDATVMIGEIGCGAEEQAAQYISEHVSKPVVGYLAGFTAPQGKTMGYAGAIVPGSSGSAAAKKTALEAAGVCVRCDNVRDRFTDARDFDDRLTPVTEICSRATVLEYPGRQRNSQRVSIDDRRAICGPSRSPPLKFR